MANLLEVTTPINIIEERKKFFASETYNPVFRYVWQNEEIRQKIEKQVKSLPAVRRDLFRSVIREDHARINVFASEFFKTKVDNVILQLSHRILKRKVPDSHHIEDITIVENAFKKAMEYFNIDYKITISNKEGFNFRPKHEMRNLLISYKANFQFLPLAGSVKHEMAHVIRYINGVYNNIPYRWQHLPTEEGLCCYIQDYHTKHGKVSLFQHAAEYAATAVALKGSLRDIYNFLRSLGFTEDFAWGRSIRHKFGFINTAFPGDIMKPSMYFYNEQKVKLLTPGELIRLFVGKISIQDLGNFPKYKGLIPQAKIKEYFELE